MFQNNFDKLLMKAIELENSEEEKTVEKLIKDVSRSEAKALPKDVERYMKKCNILLFKQKLRNATEVIWQKQLGVVNSFGNLLSKALIESGIKRKKAAKILGLAEKDIKGFEESQRPILKTKEISKLVSILDIFGIKLDILIEIINCEKKYLMSSLRLSGVEKLRGVQKSRFIDRPGYIQPSLSTFISKIREEIEERGLEELLY